MRDQTKLLLGLLICSWIFCSWMMLRSNKLEKENARLTANILSLTEDKKDEAIAFQISYSTLRTKYDSLAESAGANKHTKEIVRVRETISTVDTLVLSVADTVLVKDFSLDTCLVNDWRTACIRITPSEGVLSLADSISIKTGLTYRINSEKLLKKSYRTLFGRKVWGPLFGKKVKVDVVHVSTDNPLIEINGMDYYQIVR